VDGYLRELSQVVGTDVDLVRREVSHTRRQHRSEPQLTIVPPPEPQQGSGIPWPDPADVSLSAERGFLKLALQHPDLFNEEWDQVENFLRPSVLATRHSQHSLEHGLIGRMAQILDLDLVPFFVKEVGMLPRIRK
jgi:hypothetical protein